MSKGETSSPEPPDIDQLVMRKSDDTVQISAVVDGEQVFYAEPGIHHSKGTIRSAVQTWASRAYEDELDEDQTEAAFQ